MKIYILFAGILCSVFFTGCIYEDLSNCPGPGNFTLYFQYYGDGEKDIFIDKIEKVNLYLFDENDRLLQIQEIGQKQLLQKQGIDLFLEQGVYKVVSWGNAFQSTNIELLNPDNNMLQFWYVFPSALMAGERITTNDPIFFATHVIEAIDGVWQNDTLSFSSAHIQVEIYIEGWGTVEKRSQGKPLVEMENLYSMYDFEMENRGGKVSYYPVIERNSTEDIHCGKLMVNRFSEENDITLYIHDTDGDTHYTLPLQDFIEKNGISIDGIQEVTIPIYIRFNGINVSVSVNPWDDGGVLLPTGKNL